MSVKWMLAALLLAGGTAEPQQSLSIVHQGDTVIQIDKEDYVYDQPGVPIVDEAKLAALMDRIAEQVETEPRNAVLDGAGRIVPEKPGTKLHAAEFRGRFYSYVFEGGAAELEVPLRSVYPRVDSEILSNIKLNAIGSYATYFNSRNRNRSSNIALSAQAINNVVVFPGERFSFNGTVGKRTREKGYLRAPVIVRGELYEDIGGGICQVSSTLFNAADRAGLTIVERFSHSRNVHYVPSGRDATVSWYGPDFVFTNPYNHPILIRAFASAGAVSVSIFSSDMLETRQREVPGASKTLPEEVRVENRSVGGKRE
ncbi:VanW family protein [Paenibacillus sp. LHD-117]|uniref:VanW family protein n=1 Tax=Paenibacillus sp. LHD-117 TaxID=3071412 RepID=UPI0027E201F8|nr:VanW family protein [Paenibacillus sp. LHD-117]MDQ6418528.1 VanW family protein [Paenibacillus sp. LHD-117]